MNKSDERCKCSLAISMTGNGCRYCQPQTYIDMMQGEIEEARKQLASAETRIRELEAGYSRLADAASEFAYDTASWREAEDCWTHKEDVEILKSELVKARAALASPDRRDGHPDGESA